MYAIFLLTNLGVLLAYKNFNLVVFFQNHTEIGIPLFRQFLGDSSCIPLNVYSFPIAWKPICFFHMHFSPYRYYVLWLMFRLLKFIELSGVEWGGGELTPHRNTVRRFKWFIYLYFSWFNAYLKPWTLIQTARVLQTTQQSLETSKLPTCHDDAFPLTHTKLLSNILPNTFVFWHKSISF